MKYFFYIILSLSVIISVSVSSCFNEKFRKETDTFLEFSRDTLAFDTVFTTLGSATRSIKVYNPYSESVNIEKVYLANNANGFFRLNIDGKSGDENVDIEIGPKDSIYIFAEVTIDPNAPLTDSPFVIEDYIRFVTNTNEQSVLLTAWGQNANYIPNSKSRGTQSLLSCDFGNIIFDDPKPYVIYGVLYVDSCELIFPEGADIYVHGGVVTTDNGAYNDGVLVILENGKLSSNGTLENPVIIQGDRLENEYDDIPGQWAGIIVNDLSKGTTFTNTIIRNSVFGVRIDSLAEARFEKCQFINQLSSGIIGFHAGFIYAENCLFYNSSSANVTLAYGGKFELNYCTMASYDSGGAAIAVSNFRCIDPTCLEGLLFNPVNLKMNNCIMIGDQVDEIILSDRSIETGDFEYELNNCVVQVEELLLVPDFANFFDYCNNCLRVTVKDTVFVSPNDFNFRLDTMSVAFDKALVLPGIDDDIEGRSRNSMTPDPGCYEF